MKVSVLMAVYNAEATIAAAIESLLTQTYQDFEIIIIDDGCRDGTINIIESFKDPRIKVITNPINMGQIKSLNRGIDYCSGKLVARMDADDISLPERFELQVKAFEQDADLAIVSTNGYKMFSDGSVKKLLVTPVSKDALKIISMYKSPLHHISVMIRKSVLTPEFRFDEGIMISTDWDLWSRFLVNGHKVKVLPDRCIKFLVNENSYGSANKTVQIAEDMVLVKKNVRRFTGLSLTASQTQDILQVHYPGDVRPGDHLRQILFWLKILKHYHPDSRFDYVRAIIFELSVLTSKFLRLVVRKYLKP